MNDKKWNSITCCSHDCSNEYRRNSPKEIFSKPCIICGETIYKTGKMSIEYWNGRKFCSEECFHKDQKMKGGNITSFKKGCKINLGRKRSDIAGPNNNNWHGGVRNSKSSKYIFVMNKSHPFASQRGYTAQHRLIVESIIERYLYPEEKVHHINRIKKDNNPENLYIFRNDSDHMFYHSKENSGIMKITKSNLDLYEYGEEVYGIFE